MKVDAYLHASDPDTYPPPREILLLQFIDRFGAPAIMGRTLHAREIYRMTVAENIQTAYRSSEQATNLATWAKENPRLSRLLTEARTLAKEFDEDA